MVGIIVPTVDILSWFVLLLLLLLLVVALVCSHALRLIFEPLELFVQALLAILEEFVLKQVLVRHLQDIVNIVNFLELISPVLRLAEIFIAHAALSLTYIVLLELHCEDWQEFLDNLGCIELLELLYHLDNLSDIHLLESLHLALLLLNVILALLKVDLVEFLLKVGDVVDKPILILLELLAALID